MSGFTTARVKARKPHRCEVCPVPIEPSDTYVRSVTFYDGTACVWKTCQACEACSVEAWADGYDDGELMTADGIREWADEYKWTDQIAADLMERLNWKAAS